ncbi:hypothetical protein BHM03_00022291 [Ensete ventricosum]|nr:hypothetical protein BHM03_00022291 [Ensete ventricosum]
MTRSLKGDDGVICRVSSIATPLMYCPPPLSKAPLRRLRTEPMQSPPPIPCPIAKKEGTAIMAEKRKTGVFHITPVAMMCGREAERELSRDGSHYSLSSGILPSLGARSNRRVKLPSFIVSPYDRRYRSWETFLVILVVYTAWVSPFEFGFLAKSRGVLALIDNIVNAFFAIDIVLTFFVAYLDRTSYLLIDNRKQIAWRYLSTWFILDVASTIPSEIARKILPKNLRSYGFFNMLRLWRLRRIVTKYLKDQKDDPVMEGVLREIENMLTHGRLDLPLTLSFAVIRGDDLLLHQLLRRGLDPNESDSNGHSALVWNLYSEGSVPLWEAMVGKHEDVVRLLIKNGAALSSGDMGSFACAAAEQGSLELLKDIIRYGGDVTVPKKDMTTALHVAVCEGNVQLVEFLLEQGANIDTPDCDGWSARKLADQQGHEEIKGLFEAKRDFATSSIPVSTPASHSVGRYCSEPAIPLSSNEERPDLSWENSDRLRKTNFHNSLFGIISAAHVNRQNHNSRLLTSVGLLKSTGMYNGSSCHDIPLLRVTISCPEKGNTTGKLVLMPDSLRELLDIGSKKFDFLPTKVLTKDGAEIDDVKLIRDGDYLVLSSDAWMG